jgi:hypothetical protein
MSRSHPFSLRSKNLVRCRTLRYSYSKICCHGYGRPGCTMHTAQPDVGQRGLICTLLEQPFPRKSGATRLHPNFWSTCAVDDSSELLLSIKPVEILKIACDQSRLLG